MSVEVRDHVERSRYELFVDGAVVGIADYRLEGSSVVFPHTEVDPAFRGQGLAVVLVQFALDAARVAGHTVDPQCWYVAEFIDTHPEYQDLLVA